MCYISNKDEKCNTPLNFDGFVTMDDNGNNGRPDGQFDMVAGNPEKSNEYLMDTAEINSVGDKASYRFRRLTW